MLDDTPNDQPLRMMINHDSNNNTIEDETQPAPASVVQTHAVVESAMGSIPDRETEFLYLGEEGVT